MKKVIGTNGFVTAILTLLLISFNTASTFAQKGRKNAVGITVPVIWNYSNGVFFSTGNRSEPTGKAISYGAGIYVSREILQNIFAIAGAGFFKQKFNISRPFNFDGDTVTNLMYSTRYYDYSTWQYQIGVAYKLSIKNGIPAKIGALYNSYTSFSQVYMPSRVTDYAHKKIQESNRKFDIGYNITAIAGLEKEIADNLLLNVQLLIPLFTKWNKDETFMKYDYTPDSQKIAENRFSTGVAFSIQYDF